MPRPRKPVSAPPPTSIGLSASVVQGVFAELDEADMPAADAAELRKQAREKAKHLGMHLRAMAIVHPMRKMAPGKAQAQLDAINQYAEMAGINSQESLMPRPARGRLPDPVPA